MDSIEEMQRWIRNEKLSPETFYLLLEEGFESLDEITQLTRRSIYQLNRKKKGLPMQQCLRLEQAVERLKGENRDEQTQVTENSVNREKESRPKQVVAPSYHVATETKSQEEENLTVKEKAEFFESWQDMQTAKQPPTPWWLKSKQPDEDSRPKQVVSPSYDIDTDTRSQEDESQTAQEDTDYLEIWQDLMHIVKPLPKPRILKSKHSEEESRPKQVVAPSYHVATEDLHNTEKENVAGKGDYVNITLRTEIISEESEYHTLRFLLVGRTGSGKSATGNTILGQKLFNNEVCFGSVTTIHLRHVTQRNGVFIEVVDSPGLCDTTKDAKDVALEVIKAVACIHPGPTAVLYVISIGRYTEEEYGVYERLKHLLDTRVTEYIIIIFTRGDDLTRENKTIQDVIRMAPEKLCTVLKECGHRYVVFDNTTDDKQPQVDRLLQEVHKLMMVRRGQPYTCPKYREVGDQMEQEVAKRLKMVVEKELKTKQYVVELQEKNKKAEQETGEMAIRIMKSEAENERIMAMIKEQQEGKKIFEELAKLSQKMERKLEENEATFRAECEARCRCEKSKEKERRRIKDDIDSGKKICSVM